MANETLEGAFARSQRQRALMVPFLVIAIVAGVLGPLYVPVAIGTMRDLGLMGAFLMPFAAVMGIGWVVTSLWARRT